jgi:hypothetical protein
LRARKALPAFPEAQLSRPAASLSDVNYLVESEGTVANMLSKDSVIRWLNDGNENEAANLLDECALDCSYVDFGWEVDDSGRPTGRMIDLFDVNVGASRRILSQIDENLVSLKVQIESAIREFTHLPDFAIRDIHWVAKQVTTKGRDSKRCGEPQIGIHPNIDLLMKRMDRALEDGDYPAVLHASASVFETMAKDIVGLPSVQTQTLKGFFDRYRKDTHLPKEIIDYVLSIYESRNRTPLAGHGSTLDPVISRETAISLTEMTKAFVRIEYRLQEK